MCLTPRLTSFVSVAEMEAVGVLEQRVRGEGGARRCVDVEAEPVSLPLTSEDDRLPAKLS